LRNKATARAEAWGEAPAQAPQKSDPSVAKIESGVVADVENPQASSLVAPVADQQDLLGIGGIRGYSVGSAFGNPGPGRGTGGAARGQRTSSIIKSNPKPSANNVTRRVLNYAQAKIDEDKASEKA